MNRYPLWLLLGVASGFLWGCNNYLYAAGVYEATEGLLLSVFFSHSFVRRSTM